MSTYGFPDIMSFFDMLYGAEGVDYGGLTCLYFGNATGMVWAGNPPYFITDFWQIYSKFLGQPVNVTGATITAGSSTITVSDTIGMTVGQLVINLNSIPPDAIIQAVDPQLKTITISTLPTQNDTSFVYFPSPLIPIVAILSYLNLAMASVMQSRYHEAWPMMMALYIAHYSTMYLSADSGVPSYTAQSVAAQGLQTGIMISQAAGDVEMTTKPLDGYETFGAWRETKYGEQFMTLAATVGAGAIWVR